ncbi:MAG: hypothetical protein JKY56_21535 [Kofleriaceae bacterium]|nr:hypothetical protein [Kofleriaceae bacterium]
MVACFEVEQGRSRILEASWIVQNDQDSSAVAGHYARHQTWRKIGAHLKAALSGGSPSLLSRIPQGGITPDAHGNSGIRGVLSGTHALLSPAGGHECLAYSLELRMFWQGQELLMYRDAVTSGLRVSVPTGQELRIPAGRLRFSTVAPEIVDVDNLELEAYLDIVDPMRSTMPGGSPIRFNVVREEVLFAGDTVDVTGDFYLRANSSEFPSYRESPSTYLRCRGIAQLGRVG